jgi:hypothetical protein
MRNSGVDVDKYKRDNLLKIHSVPNPMEHPEGYAKALGAIIESVLSDVK